MSEDTIRGNPADVDKLVLLFSRLGADLENTGNALKKVDTGAYTGQAAETLRANYLDAAPADWLTAADALTAGSSALRVFGAALVEAKGRYARAKEALDAAQQAPGPPPVPNPAVEQANAEMRAAQDAWQQAGDEAAQALRSATEVKATVQVSWGDKVASFFGGHGVIAGLEDYGKMLLWSPLNPIGMIGSAAQTVSAGVAMWKDPGRIGTTLSQAIDLPTLRTNPAAWAGRLIPNAIPLLIGGVEGIGSKAAKTAEGEGTGVRTLERPKNHEDPPPHLEEPDRFYHEGDPPSGETDHRMPVSPHDPPSPGGRPELQGSGDPPPSAWNHPPPPQAAIDQAERLGSERDRIQFDLNREMAKPVEGMTVAERQAHEAEIDRLSHQKSVTEREIDKLLGR